MSSPIPAARRKTPPAPHPSLLKSSPRLRSACALALAAALSTPAQAAVSIALGNGVSNPSPTIASTGLNPQEFAVADTITLVPVANFSGILQSVLNAQGFTAANNWSLVTNNAPLDANATFTVSDYHLFLNGTGTAFGQNIDFTLNPNLASPAVPGGSTATLHWLQYVNTNAKVNNYGFAINGQQGFWQLDNGQVNGGAAAGAATGPYYDSNANPGDFSTPPTFHDAPQFYAGEGTYLHFTAIPVWDIYTPAAGEDPATESINVGNYGISWGFAVIPEPSSSFAFIFVLSLGMRALRRRRVE